MANAASATILLTLAWVARYLPSPQSLPRPTQRNKDNRFKRETA